jgi:hypothetical protein
MRVKVIINKFLGVKKARLRRAFYKNILVKWCILQII